MTSGKIRKGRRERIRCSKLALLQLSRRSELLWPLCRYNYHFCSHPAPVPNTGTRECLSIQASFRNPMSLLQSWDSVQPVEDLEGPPTQSRSHSQDRRFPLLSPHMGGYAHDQSAGFLRLTPVTRDCTPLYREDFCTCSPLGSTQS